MGKFDVKRFLEEADRVDREFGDEAPAPGIKSPARGKSHPPKEKSRGPFILNTPPEETALRGVAFRRAMGAMGIHGKVDKL